MTDYYDKQEQKMGIRAYASPESQGFAAVLKARYSDFVVHEVDVQGNMARLDSLENNLKEQVTAEGTCADEIDSEIQKAPNNKRTLDNITVSETSECAVKKSKIEDKDDGIEAGITLFDKDKQQEAKEKLSALIGDDSASEAIKMLTFWENSSGNDKNYVKHVTFPFIEDKDKRKAIHMLIRSDLLSCCSLADTVDKKVRIWHKKFEREMPNFGNFSRGKPKGNKSKNRNKVAWPKDRPNFLKFVLYKENVDTGTAARDISYAARLPPKGRGGGGVGYAGMKDKRGITSQFCTIYRKTPDVILSLNNNKKEGRGNNFGGGNTKSGGRSIIKVGNFSYVDKEVRLGELRGNRFDIVLRNVCIVNSNDLVEDEKKLQMTRDHLIGICNAMKENGFINYFGMQRFGKFYDTHEVGIAILKGNFEKACEIILRVKKSEDERQSTLRRQWESRFIGIDMTDESAVREAEAKCAKAVLKHLGRFMTCETSILNGLSRRPRDYKSAFQKIAKNLRSMFLHAYQSLLWNKAVSHRILTGGSKQVIVGDLVLVEDKSESEGGGGTSGLKGKSVKILSEDDVKSNKYTIYDVVLSLVGTKVEYPNNSTGEMYDTMLTEDGLTKSDFQKMNDKEMSLCGDYRKIMCKPTDIEFEIKAYQDPHQPLIRSDLMKVHNVELDCIDLTEDSKITTNGNILSQKFLIGMIIGFTLPASTYATIALRELMRRPTSSEYQSSLQLEGDCEAKLLEKKNETSNDKDDGANTISAVKI